MDQKRFHDLLMKYCQGTCTPDEKKVIDDWFSAIKTSEKPFSDWEDEHQSKKTSWAGLESYLQKTSPDEFRPSRKETFRSWSLIGVAASVGLLLVAGFLMKVGISSDSEIAERVSASLPDLTSRVNESAVPVDFSLPEGSKITLFPGSKVSFSESFTGPERQVLLEGEAFFDVAPDKTRPFLVFTKDLTTRVLGTSFLIKVSKEQKETVVSVRTGKVSVYPNVKGKIHTPDPGQEIILTPNQQLVYNAEKKQTLKQIVSKPAQIIPRDNAKYQYTNTPVVDILTNLQKTYGIEIVFDAAELSNCTLTSDMSDEGFMEQIKIICNALGAEYQVSETSVIIKAAGCNAY